MINKNVAVRLATVSDIDSIEQLMKRSMMILGKGYYTEKQLEACCRFVCVPDRQLIEDQTFFVAVAEGGVVVGCGGWSFRNKLHAGPKLDDSKNLSLNPSFDHARIRAMFVDPAHSRKGIATKIMEASIQAAKLYGFSKGILGATLSGVDFYISKGWKHLVEEESELPDGTSITVVTMEKVFD